MMLPPNFSDKNVCIIGLGYVGLTLAVALADVGFRIYGVERDQRILDFLKRRQAHFSEVGLDAKLADQLDRSILTATQHIPRDCAATVFIITVGTPIGPDKKTRIDALRTVATDLAQVLKAGDLVMLRSTVRVRTTRDIVEPILKACGKPFDLAFCPERTLEGRALTELRSLPQIVGGIDFQSTFRASQFFSLLTPSVVRVADPETAELAKLINNTQRDLMFGFANEVAAMCDAAGLSALEVIAAANLGYSRSSVPLPGPVGGPCLEKDPYILAEGLESYGFIPQLSLSGRRWNELLPQWTVKRVADRWRERSCPQSQPERVSVLGLAFKGRPETDDLRGTPAIEIIARLRAEFPKARILGFDPIVSASAIKELGIEPTSDVEQAFRDTSIVLIQNNHEFFTKMPMQSLAGLMRSPGLVYDYWNQTTQTPLPAGVNVELFGLGTSPLGRGAA
jgi:UDP-N-acetyl-D-mannosaminuronic acid dehydrogenase